MQVPTYSKLSWYSRILCRFSGYMSIYALFCLFPLACAYVKKRNWSKSVPSYSHSSVASIPLQIHGDIYIEACMSPVSLPPFLPSSLPPSLLPYRAPARPPAPLTPAVIFVLPSFTTCHPAQSPALSLTLPFLPGRMPRLSLKTHDVHVTTLRLPLIQSSKC